MKVNDSVKVKVWKNTTNEYVFGLNELDYLYGKIHQIINVRVYVEFQCPDGKNRILPCSFDEIELV